MIQNQYEAARNLKTFTNGYRIWSGGGAENLSKILPI